MLESQQRRDLVRYRIEKLIRVLKRLKVWQN